MGKSLSKKHKVSGSAKTVLLFLMIVAFSKSWGQTTDLIFSEYVEGSSNNKYIEIYNGTGATVNLADYKLRLYANGVSAPTNDVALSGSLATCSVVVYKNSSAALTLPGGVSATANAAVNFNGDDAVVLFKVSTNSIVDIIGQIGCDPGSAWTATGYSTLDKTLVRKAGVCGGITANPGAACGVGSFPTLSTEWDIYNTDDVSNLGSHTNSCGGCGAAGTHTVTFNANTGTGSMSAQTASTTTNLTNNAFTKAGCTFAGWNTAANGSGTAYSDGQAYSFAADLTLYAQWNCGGSTCPYFVAAVINACAGSCSGEGNNEFVVMNSGSYSIPVNGTNLNLVYNNGTDNYFTQSYAAQPATISNLNSLAGCGTLFVDASTGTIPPNSTFFIMNQGSCFNNGSFSAYCGVGTIYVAFSTDATWSPGGFFTNNNNPRYFRTDFTSINAACGVTTYSYNNANEFSFGNDGSSVVFNGTTPSYVTGDGNCVPPVTILPISLVDFFATVNGDKNDIVWKVASEEGIRNYVVEKSEDGIHFMEHARLVPNGSQGKYTTYSTEDVYPYKGITYYRLSTIEGDYSFKHYGIVDVDRSSKDWKTLIYQDEQDVVLEFKNTIPKNSSVDLFDLAGKVLISKAIDQSHVKLNTNDLTSGIYFVRVTTAYKTENFKIVIQK